MLSLIPALAMWCQSVLGFHCSLQHCSVLVVCWEMLLWKISLPIFLVFAWMTPKFHWMCSGCSVVAHIRFIQSSRTLWVFQVSTRVAMLIVVANSVVAHTRSIQSFKTIWVFYLGSTRVTMLHVYVCVYVYVYLYGS